MKKINDRFSEILLHEISENPQLKDSLFARLKPDMMTFFGFEQELRSWKEYGALEDYKKLESKARLSPQTSLDANDESANEMLERIFKGWRFNPEKNLPYASQFFYRMEGFDIFFDVVEKAISQIDKEMDVLTQIKNLREFLDAHSPRKVSDRDLDKLLLKTGSFIVLGYEAFDPIEALRGSLAEYANDPSLSSQEQIKKLKADIEENMRKWESNKDLNPDQIKKIRAFRKHIPFYLRMLDEMEKTLADTKEGEKLRSALRREAVRNSHPYLAQETIKNSHHTHVASTVAKQDPRIRIYPIKVTTQSVSSPTQDAELGRIYGTELRAWLDSPLGRELIAQIFAEHNIKKVSQSRVESEIKKYIKSNPLNFLFADEVFKAIQETGEQKIKLANVSLGILFKKDHSLGSAYASAANELFSEFVRYKMGETIQKYAPQTLFFVATGNDGAWVDGVTKSAFPVGISSNRLEKISREKNLPEAPNNSLRNVIGVASVNPAEETLTSFTNLLIDSKVPQIFSTGEEILAGVPTRSRKIHDELTQELFKAPEDALEVLKGVVDEIPNPQEPKALIEISRQKLFLSTWSLASNHLQKAYATILHATQPIQRQRMSGTSMATPTATGVFAEYIIKKAQSLGIKASELYDHPQFSAEVLMEDLFRISKAKKIGIIELKMLIEGINTWKEAPGEKEV